MKKITSLFVTLSIVATTYFITGCAKQEKPTENISIDIDQAMQVFGKPVDPQPQITAETPLALVNGKSITHGELQNEMMKLAKGLPKTLTPEQLQQAQQQIANQALQNLIQMNLVQEALAKSGTTASETDIGTQVAKVKGQLKEGQTLDAELAKQNLNEEQYRKIVGQKLSMEHFFAEISKSATPPTDAEMQTFYNENTNRFTRAAGVEARHILFKATTEDPGELFVAKKRAARTALERVKAGESFDKLIIELSEGPNAQNGGVLGFLQQGNTAPEIAEHVFKIDEGAFTEVVRTQYGFHIIQVTKIHEALTISFEDAKENIGQVLLQQKKQKLVEEYVSDLRKNADIQILNQ